MNLGNKKGRGKYFNSYTEADIEQAERKVKVEGISISEAARMFSIPRITLNDRIHKMAKNVHGTTQILSKEVESDLSEWIIQCASYGDPRNKRQILEEAAKLSQLNPQESRRFKNGLPTEKWLQGFLQRNPQIARRTPSSISRASALVSKRNIIGFITETKCAIQTKIGEANFEALAADPTAWGNCDETNFELNPVPRAVFGKKGDKAVYLVETAKPKENVSVMF